MDCKSIGYLLSSLRKKSGLTQAQVAEKLKVSNKAVSKWESGLGYPEVTQFPALAELYGVSIDYIMTGERRGIVIAGNILVDLVKNVDCYPKIGMLANISNVTRSVGGCVPNTAIDIAKIDRDVPLSAIGKVGDDEYGRYVISMLQKYGIDTGKISVSAENPTSFSDVISMPSGERTFFHASGANAEFSPADIDVTLLNCRILHIGYILLLDSFDKYDPEYGTVMAKFLKSVQDRGIKTSIDVVSDSTADYKAKIVPALKYCNYVIINEIECCTVWGIEPYDPSGKIIVDNIKLAMEKTAESGVADKVVVHSKAAGFCLDVASGEFTAVLSFIVPPEDIKGSVGAGDTFCAACLYCLYNNCSDKQMLEFASAAAVTNLFAENSIDGVLPKSEILKINKKYRRYEYEKICL